MKVSEAKQKICPFMNGYEVVGNIAVSKPKYCICSDCMAWVYTKETEKTESKRYIKALCKCGKSEDTEHICWECGDVASEHRGGFERTYSYGDGTNQLEEDEKEGYCKRLNK